MASGKPVYGSGLLDLKPEVSDSNIQGLESSLKSSMGKIGTVVGVAAGAAIAAGAAVGIQQEAIGDKLAAQLRLSEDESKAAGQIAGSLYADAYGESFEAVNEAVGSVIGTLVDDLSDPAVIEGLTAKALDLATAFDLDVTEAVTRAGVLLKTGLAGDADEAMDLIAASMQEIAPGLRDELGEATTEYSRFFADLGFSGEEMFALLAAADDKFALDKTGDAIKELSIRATDMSALSVGAFEAMGLDAQEMSNKILAGGDTAKEGFDEIVAGLLAIEDPTTQANTAIALFGTPIEDLSTAQIPEFLTSLQNMGGGLGDVAGRADELGDTLNTNAQTKITTFKRTIEQTLARVVEMPGLLGGAATAVAGFGAVLGPVAPALTGIAVVFGGPLSAAMTGIGAKMSGLIVQSAHFIASQVATAASFVAQWVMMGVQSLLHAAKVAAAWLIAMGPIGWVIAAVVALVALIVANWDTIKEIIGKAWEWVKTTTETVWNAITGFFTTVADTIRRTVEDVREWVIAAFRKAVDFVYNLFLNFTPLGLIIQHFDKIKGLATEVGTWIKDKFDDVVEFFTKMPQRISDAVSGLWDGIKEAFRSGINWIIRKWNDFSLNFEIPNPFGDDFKLSINTPNIPLLDSGGLVEPVAGQSHMLAIVKRGERVLTEAQNAALEAGAGLGRITNIYTIEQGPRLARMIERESAYQLALGG